MGKILKKNRKIHKKDRKVLKKYRKILKKNRKACKKYRKILKKNRKVLKKNRKILKKNKKILKKNRKILLKNKKLIKNTLLMMNRKIFQLGEMICLLLNNIFIYFKFNNLLIFINIKYPIFKKIILSSFIYLFFFLENYFNFWSRK